MSGISNGVVMITVPWIVLESTGSAAKAGLLAALSSLPGIVVSPVVGGLIDRFGRRAISIFSDLMSMLSVLLFLLVNALSDLTYAWILAIAVLGACFDPAGYTARKALIPNAATASGVEINSANGRHEGIFAIGWMVGPAIGSVCIQWRGPMLGGVLNQFLFDPHRDNNKNSVQLRYANNFSRFQQKNDKFINRNIGGATSHA